MRTVYLGTSSFAATVLSRLAQSAHRPVLVISPPDRPRGRGQRTLSPPVAELAAELEIDLLQVQKATEPRVIERIRAAGAQGAAICAFGQLIREPLLSELAILNVHPSLLPRWRGAAPIERAIMAGDARTGVSIMRLSEGLDSGPVAMREELEIGAEDDYETLAGKLAILGGEMLCAAFDLQAEGALKFEEQAAQGVIYAEKIDSAERRLEPARAAEDLARTVRALTPHIGAYLQTAGGERLGVRRARPVDVGVRSGELRAEWGALLLGCGRGALRLEVVQPPGGKPMAAEAYLRGHSPPKL